jgi:hypothetical protein
MAEEQAQAMDAAAKQSRAQHEREVARLTGHLADAEARPLPCHSGLCAAVHAIDLHRLDRHAAKYVAKYI